MAFSNLLQLAAESERQTIEAFVTKNPQLRDLYEAGEVVASLKPRLDTLKVGSVSDAVGELEKWNGWKAKDWADWKAIHTNTENALQAAQSRIEELEAKGETDMNADDIRKIIAEEVGKIPGLVKQADIDKVAQSLEEKLGAAADNLTNRFESVYADVTPLMHQHSRDFDGEVLNPKDVFATMETMAKERNTHVSRIGSKEAYDRLVAPKRAEKAQKDIDAKLAEAEKRGEAKGRQEAIASTSSTRGPVDNRGGVSRMGPLQRRQLERMKSKTDAATGTVDAPLGKGIVAAHAAQQRTEREMAGAAS